MSLKNRFQSLLALITRHFLMPFCLSVFAIFASFSIFGLDLYPLSQSLILYTGLTFGFLTFFLRFKRLPEQSPARAVIIEFLSPLFLMSLLILTLSNLDFLTTRLDLHLIKTFNPTLTLISIFSGFLVFYANRDRVEKEIEEEKNNFSICLLIIFIVFVAIKILLPIMSTGSYLDEYTHILSGINYLSSGHFAEFYHGQEYTRGEYISLIAALVVKIFGNNMVALKMIPASLGIVNFFLLYAVSRRINMSKWPSIILMIVYTISPWVIFNHLYIRMYVFYEFFILLVLNIFLYALSQFKKDKVLQANIAFIVIAIVDVIAYLFSNDLGSLAIVIFTGSLFLYFSFFIAPNINSHNQLVNRIFKAKVLYKILFFTIVISPFVILFQVPYMVLSVFSQTIKYTTPADLKYANLFLNLNFAFTILFIASTKRLFTNNKNIYLGSAIFGSSVLFFMHIASPDSIQLTRGILYFLPLFYMVAISYLSYIKSNYINYFLIAILLITVIGNYPTNFLLHPYIPKEVTYIDDYAYVGARALCNGKIIITSSRPGILLFFGIKPDFYVNTKYNDRVWVASDEESSLAYFSTTTGMFFDTYSDTPIIKNVEEFRTIYNTYQNICYITGALPYSWINNDVRSFIDENFIEEDKKYRTNETSVNMKLYLKS